MCALLSALVYMPAVGIKSNADLPWGWVREGPCWVGLVLGAGGGVGSDVGQESSNLFGGRSLSGGQIGLGEGAGWLLSLAGGWACPWLVCVCVGRVEVRVLGVVSCSSRGGCGRSVGRGRVDLDYVRVVVEL